MIQNLPAFKPQDTPDIFRDIIHLVSFMVKHQENAVHILSKEPEKRIAVFPFTKLCFGNPVIIDNEQNSCQKDHHHKRAHKIGHAGGFFFYHIIGYHGDQIFRCSVIDRDKIEIDLFPFQADNRTSRLSSRQGVPYLSGRFCVTVFIQGTIQMYVLRHDSVRVDNKLAGSGIDHAGKSLPVIKLHNTGHIIPGQIDHSIEYACLFIFMV